MHGVFTSSVVTPPKILVCGHELFGEVQHHVTTCGAEGHGNRSVGFYETHEPAGRRIFCHWEGRERPTHFLSLVRPLVEKTLV
jgi:hypothetical protein